MLEYYNMIYNERATNLNKVNTLTLNYIKNADEYDEDIINDVIEVNNNNQDNVINNENNNAITNTTYTIDRYNVKLFSSVKGAGYPGIWDIKFIPGTGISITRYGNAYSYLPISSSLIYTAIIQTPIPSYSQPSNILSGTYNDVVDYQLNYGAPLGQDIITPVTFSGQVYAIEKDSLNNIYIGGNFTIVVGNGGSGSTIINDLAKWNGVTWSDVYGFSLADPAQSVMSIAIIGSEIYVGGNFTIVNWTKPNEIVPINVSSFIVWRTDIGGAWTNGDKLGRPVNLYDSVGDPAQVYVMKFSKNFLYLGGNIKTCVVGSSSSIIVNNIFRFDARISSSTWLRPSTLRGGASSDVYAIDADTTGNIYIGGSFVSVRNTNTLIVRKIARWNFTRNRWEQIISSQGPTTNNNRIGLNNNVYAVAVNPTNQREIWFGGLFINDRKRTNIPTSITYLASFNTSNRIWTQRPWTKATPGT